MIEPQRTKQSKAASTITSKQQNICQLVEVAADTTNLITPLSAPQRGPNLTSLDNSSSCATTNRQYIDSNQMSTRIAKESSDVNQQACLVVNSQGAGGNIADSNVLAGQQFGQANCLEVNKKRSIVLLGESMQMRSSQIEFESPVELQWGHEKRISCRAATAAAAKSDGNIGSSDAIARVEVCLSKNDLKCHPFKVSSSGLVKGASEVVTVTKYHREPQSEWTTKIASLFKRVARFGGGGAAAASATTGSSRSFSIQTGIGKSASNICREKNIIESAITSLVRGFRSNLEDVSKGERRSDSNHGSSSRVDYYYGNETTTGDLENETASLSHLEYGKTNNIPTSFSCQSKLNSKQLLVTETRDLNGNSRTTNQEIAYKSSYVSPHNITPKQLYSTINMSASGNLMKNKYLIEDKMRRQQLQKNLPSSQFNVQNEPDLALENRRSTYCSSMGATDINYDSSYSSVINCSERNNTCATLNQINSRDSVTNKQFNQDNNEEHKRLSGDEFITESKKVAVEDIKKRENWKNIEFLLAVIGFAVDLGNVWRFPYICYKNGGGAFLIPYTIMFILGGLPIFYLEMSLGQYFSSGCLTVWKRVCPLAKGIGYAMCLLNFYTGLYYNTVISWAVFFFVESFTSVLPWTSCNNSWNSPDCRTIDQRQALKLNSTLALQSTNEQTYYSSPTKDYFEREVLQLHLSTGIDDLGQVRKPLAIYLAIVFVLIYFAIWKGVKSTGKAVWVTALLPYFVLIPLLLRGVFLEGAWLGIKYYLYPEWGKIIVVDVWVEAAKQIYFSLGPGFGTLMALSSYNKFNHNCRKDALIAASVNYFASFISGLVIFAVLGYMATIENVSVEDVATEGPGLVFQVYPEGLATMQFSSMWSVLFFIMVITLGIDSTFGGLESVITGLCDEYPHTLRANRGIFIGILIVLIYLCSLPTTTFGGNYVIYVVESYGTSLSLLFIVLVETIIVCWLYGADRFCKNLEEMYGDRPGPYWRVCWKYISPTILLLIFIAACGQELDKYHVLSNGNYTYPGWAPTVGLLMTGSSVCCIPIYAIYHLKSKTSGGSFYERLKIAIKPIEINQKVENENFEDAYIDKIREENRIDY